MPELVGFQTMVILDPNGMAFDAVGAFGLVFHLLFKSGSSYCGGPFLSKLKKNMEFAYNPDLADMVELNDFDNLDEFFQPYQP